MGDGVHLITDKTRFLDVDVVFTASLQGKGEVAVNNVAIEKFVADDQGA
jgi:hypothetical protein